MEAEAVSFLPVLNRDFNSDIQWPYGFNVDQAKHLSHGSFSLMSKNKAGSVGDKKGEGVESEAPRMITSQTATSGLAPARPALALQAPGPTYIVQSHHEMKSFGKSARPIAPAPPSQPVQTLAARHVQSSQTNIPSIISPTIAPVSNEGLVSLNVVTTTASSGLGTVTHNPIPLPVTLSQPSVLQLGSTTPAGNTTVVQQGINMLRGSGAGQQPQPQIQAFATQNFSHLPRGTATLSVPKSAAVLRQGPAPSLQNLTALNTGVTPLSLPLARAPLMQTVKTTTAQAARSQSPAVGGQPAPQVQPQDLSRPNFPLHGSITPVTSGTLAPPPMHITLNRMTTPINPESANIQGRTLSAQVQNETPVNIQPRISVSLSSDSNIHQRITADLARSTLPFTGATKVNHPSLGPQAKVITAQQAAPIKSAKVTPQRQHPLGSIPQSSAPLPGHVSTSSSPLSVASAQSSISVPHSTIAVSSLPSSAIASSTSSLSTNAGDGGPLRHDQPGIAPSQPSAGGIIISELANRPPGSILTMTTLAASVQAGSTPLVVSQSDNRSNSSGQQFDVKPGDSMWLQHYVYQQVTQQPPLVPQQAQIVRPGTNTLAAFLPSQGKIQAQTPSLAATQLAAMSVASSSNVCFNPGTMMMVDQLRQQHQQQQQQQHQQLPIHSPFITGTTTASTAGDKANLTSRATIASSIYTASVGVQSQIAGAGGGGGGSSNISGGLSAVPVSTNSSSSPRPSILRKRPSEAAGVVIRKPNFNLNQDSRCHSPPRVDTNSSSVSSPKISTKNFSPVSENSQSSTDTALSSNDATTPTHNHNDKGKGDGEDCMENGPTSSTSTVNNIPASPAVSHTGSLSEASPRKRARKQLLHANEELKDNMSSSEEELDNTSHRQREDSLKDHKHKEREMRGEYTDEEGVRWVLNKPKPTFVLLQPDLVNNKTRNNHFTRYSDVKPKEERRPTVNELSNQRGIMQKVNGWKLYFTASQLEELMEVEKDMQDQFGEVQAALALIPTHKINNEEAVKIHEMSQANIQRCQLIQNQLTEARTAMLRTLEHKPRIQEIVNKHMSKRPIKKKERT